MKTLQQVVAGLDFSSRSFNALRQAHRMARWDGARCLALHVLDKDVVEDLGDRVDVSRDELLTGASRRLSAEVESALGPDHGVETEVVIGHPFRAIVTEVERRRAGLLVLGSSGSGDDPARVGTVAGRCVRKAPVNVLLVRALAGGSFRRIVTGVDFSDTAVKAARHAVHIALRDGAELLFLHIHQPPALMMDDPGYFGTLDVALMDQFDDELLASAVEKLKDFARERIEEAGASSLTWRAETLRHGNVRAAINEFLQETGADLAVIGTIGRTGLKSLLLGTTAEKVLHHAPCSVLTVKPDGFGYEIDG
ncbi:MAG TPA: universal stress protein [Verrucomicrobiales bacterium]|nr:universal stress protein [Verrucomicrobiales bacterium]